MRIVVCKDRKKLGALVAAEVARLLRQKPDAVLGLPTGSSPVETYAALAALHAAGKLSFRQARTINMDEYVGLGPEHPQSFRYFMEEHLFRYVDLPRENIAFFNGMAEDSQQECQRYDEILTAWGGIDLQLAGIGGNGHVAFNEPAPAFSETSHVVRLTEETRQANQRFFSSPEEVPTYAFTQGMGQICAARRILMIASGTEKADAVYHMLCGAVTPQLPASLLQTAEDVSVYVDRALADEIRSRFGVAL